MKSRGWIIGLAVGGIGCLFVAFLLAAIGAGFVLSRPELAGPVAVPEPRPADAPEEEPTAQAEPLLGTPTPSVAPSPAPAPAEPPEGTIGGSDTGYGRGSDVESWRVPQVRTGNAEVRGSLSQEVIRRVVRRHIREVRFCYEQELIAHPGLGGRISVAFVISPSGGVNESIVTSSTLGSAALESCITQSVRRWTFPAPEGGGVVAVTYPFILAAE